MLCLATCMRNAQPALRTWFGYHIAAGITHFFVVDHRPSEDDTSEYLASLAAAYPQNVRVTVREGPYTQSLWTRDLANAALEAAGDGPVALFFHDSDEFVAGNGAPLRQRAEETWAVLRGDRSHRYWAPEHAVHVITPPCNMLPPALGPEDATRWSESRVGVPASLAAGKSSLFARRASEVRVTDGCAHRVRTAPPSPNAACPRAASGDYLWPLPPDLFPTVYSHHCYLGPERLWTRIRHFIETGMPASMQRRYGRKQGFTDDRVADFVAWVHDATPEEARERASRLYLREIYSCAHGRCVHLDPVATFCHGAAPSFDAAREAARLREVLGITRTHEHCQKFVQVEEVQ